MNSVECRKSLQTDLFGTTMMGWSSVFWILQLLTLIEYKIHRENLSICVVIVFMSLTFYVTRTLFNFKLLKFHKISVQTTSQRFISFKCFKGKKVVIPSCTVLIFVCLQGK
jgi:hypothetical protein